MSDHNLWYTLTWLFFALNTAGWGLILMRPVVGGGVNPLGLRLMFTGTVGDLVYDVATHHTVYALLDAAYLAWVIWLWWNRGGGDRTRKRLSRLKRHLSVRQPVPQGA